MEYLDLLNVQLQPSEHWSKLENNLFHSHKTSSFLYEPEAFLMPDLMILLHH